MLKLAISEPLHSHMGGMGIHYQNDFDVIYVAFKWMFDRKLFVLKSLHPLLHDVTNPPKDIALVQHFVLATIVPPCDPTLGRET